jgi:L-lactate dehydrogenase (cytochrome)
MMALGAKGVLIGRAWAYALAAGGEAGVSALLAHFSAELNTAMALTGCSNITDISSDMLVRNGAL